MNEHHGQGGHGGHGDHAAMFRTKFWWSLGLTLPIVAYSEMVQDWLGFSPPSFPGDGLVAPVLGTAVFLWGGRPFLEGGLAEVRSRRPGMMLLISMAIFVAFVASAATSLGAFDLEFWWELGALITIMLLGHWQEMKPSARRKARWRRWPSCCPTTPSGSVRMERWSRSPSPT